MGEVNAGDVGAELVDPKVVGLRLRQVLGAGKVQVRAISRRAARVSLTRAAWLGDGAGEVLLGRVEEVLREAGYRATRSDRGVYQGGRYIPTVVVGRQMWEEERDAPVG